MRKLEFKIFNKETGSYNFSCQFVNLAEYFTFTAGLDSEHQQWTGLIDKNRKKGIRW